MTLEPARHNPVHALFVRVGPHDRNDAIDRTLKRLPAITRILNAKERTQRTLTQPNLLVNITPLIDEVVAQIRIACREQISGGAMPRRQTSVEWVREERETLRRVCLEHSRSVPGDTRDWHDKAA